MTDGATDDLFEDVAATFVRRQDPVGDEEGGGAAVVGEDAERDGAVALRPALVEGLLRQFAPPLDQRDEEVGVVVRDTPDSAEVTRSRPAPVSIDGLGGGSAGRWSRGRTA